MKILYLPNKPDSKGQILETNIQNLYEFSSVVEFIKTENRMMVAGGRGKREWGVMVEWVLSFSLGR